MEEQNQENIKQAKEIISQEIKEVRSQLLKRKDNLKVSSNLIHNSKFYEKNLPILRVV